MGFMACLSKFLYGTCGGGNAISSGSKSPSFSRYRGRCSASWRQPSGFLSRGAEARERKEKLRRMAALFRGCDEHLAQIAALISVAPALDTRSSMKDLRESANPFLEAAHDSKLITELSQICDFGCNASG